MPVTEIAVLCFNTPYTTDPLVKLLREAKVAQPACAGYPVNYYADPEREDTIYLVGGWKDESAHQEWIKSTPNQRLMGQITPFLNVSGLSLRHVEIDPVTIPAESQVLVWRIVQENEEESVVFQLPEGAEDVIWEGRGSEIERPTIHHHLVGYSSAKSQEEVLKAWKSYQGEWKTIVRVEL